MSAHQFILHCIIALIWLFSCMCSHAHGRELLPSAILESSSSRCPQKCSVKLLCLKAFHHFSLLMYFINFLFNLSWVKKKDIFFFFLLFFSYLFLPFLYFIFHLPCITFSYFFFPSCWLSWFFNFSFKNRIFSYAHPNRSHSPLLSMVTHILFLTLSVPMWISPTFSHLNQFPYSLSSTFHSSS